jgi:hypothetical protein
LGILLLLVAIAVGGHGLWRIAWAHEAREGRLRADAGSCEHAAASVACGFALCVALDWALAFAHALWTTTIVGGELAIAALGAAAIFVKVRSANGAPPLGALGRRVDRPLVLLLAVVPLAAWLAYAAVRGLVVPVVSPDANAYHFPKALLLLESHGYAHFAHPDFRVTGYPFDYELLLADVLAVDGSDRGTACITVAFFALFLLATAAQAERVARGTREAVARAGISVATIVVASTPIALLLSGEHKNDLLAAAAATLAFLFLGRWVALGERLYGFLTIACVALDVGTKASGAFAALVAAPLYVVGLVRSLREAPRPRREGLLHGAAILAAGALLGGAIVVVNLVHGSGPFGVAPAMEGDMVYGAWKNLLTFPPLLAMVPYSRSALAVYVPWRHQYWWWMTYEMHTSHYGILFTPIAVAAVAFVVHDVRRSPPSLARTSRLVTLGASVATVLVMVPMRISPPVEGSFHGFPRFLLFVVPAVVAYVAPRAWAALTRRAGAPRFEAAAVALASAFFAWSAVRIARRDIYEPFDYVWNIFVNAGDAPAFPLKYGDRVAFVLDRIVGPRDKVLFDAGFDAWTYPAFGGDRKRTIAFAPASLAPLAPLEIPDDVRWVAVDRAYSVLWGDRGFKTMADAPAHFYRGKPAPEDLRTIRQLDADPRFRMVYRSYKSNQALYERRPAGAQAGADPRPIVVLADP